MRAGARERSLGRVSKSSASSVHRIVVAGGGVAAWEAVMTLRALVPSGEITIVAPERDLLFPRHPTCEPFGHERPHRFDLETVAQSAGTRMIPARIVAVDPERRLAETDDGEQIGYDTLLVAPRAKRGVELEGAITFWGAASAADIHGLLTAIESEAVQSVVFAAHRRSGVPLSLYELAVLTSWHLRRTGARRCRLALATFESAPLEALGTEVSTRVGALLDEHGIDLQLECEIEGVDDSALVHSQGMIPADRTITLPGLRGPGIAGLPSDDQGFIPADELGRVTGAVGVYVAGGAVSGAEEHAVLAAGRATAVAAAIAAQLAEPQEQDFSAALNGRGGRFLRTHLEGLAGRELVPHPPPAFADAWLEAAPAG